MILNTELKLLASKENNNSKRQINSELMPMGAFIVLNMHLTH